MDIVQQLFLNMLHDAVILETRREIGQIEKDDRIFIQVLLERRILGNLKVSKQMTRVTRLVIVGSQHLGCHRLAETAAA